MTAFRRRHALAASWRRLAPRDRAEFARFVLLIPAIKLALMSIGFRRTQALLSRCSGSSLARTDAVDSRSPLRAQVGVHEDAERAAVRALLRARRYAPYRGNCLPQSLALWWRLRRLGLAPQLCLGARMDAGVFAAHAWVEIAGRTLNDTPDVRRRFSAFGQLERALATTHPPLT